MKLFIANTTKQRHIFNFRVLETGNLRNIPIAPGGQEMVFSGSSDQIEAIIAHHSAYGLLDASKIDQARDFVGLAYSIDRPVSYGNIEKGIRDNDNFLNNDSFERRQVAAGALDQQLNESGIGYQGSVEMSAEQQVNKNDPNDVAQINEKIKTDRKAAKSDKKK